jgi:hypothetical protein
VVFSISPEFTGTPTLNAGITPVTTGTGNLGSATLWFNNLYIGGATYYTKITPASPAASESVAVPTTTTSSDTFAVLGTAQTFTAGPTFSTTAPTFSVAPVLSSGAVSNTAGTGTLGTSSKWFNSLYLGTGATYYTELTPAVPSASEVLTIPATGATDTLAVLGTAQTFTAGPTFSTTAPIFGTGMVTSTAGTGTIGSSTKWFNSIYIGTGATYYTELTPAVPSASEVLTIPATGATDTLAVLGTQQTFTAGPKFSTVAPTISMTTNQLITGTGSNLTTSTYPVPSGAITLTFPLTSEYMVGANSDTTTSHVLHATAVAGVFNSAAIAYTDLPTGTGSNQVVLGGAISAGGPTGGATSIPVITYNAAGQLTTVTTATPTVSAVNGVSFGSGSAAGTIPDTTSSSASSWTATPTLGVQGTAAGSLTIAGTTGTSGSLVLNGSSSGSATITTSSTGVLGLPSGTTATSMSLTTPSLGVASATTINKVTITAPATGSTLTIADGTTLSNTYTMNAAKQAGVAGGIPWFDSTTSMSASALLTQYGVLYGGGAGAAPAAVAACGAGIPIVGSAAAPVCSKVTLTSPTTGSTLTIADGKTLTDNNNVTLTGTDGVSINLTDAKTRSCEMVWGGTNTSNVIQAGDDAIVNNGCYNNTGYTWMITAVACMVDTTSTALTVNPTFGTDGTGTTLLSGALQCGNGTAYEYETNTAASISISSASIATANGIRPVQGGTVTGIHSVHVVFTYTTP